MKGKRFWGIFAVCILSFLLFGGCRQKEPVSAYATLKQESAVILADGTQIDCWENDFWQFYCLKDGTELLTLQPPVGPQNVFAAGVEGFEDLPPEAQETVAAYYEKQGTLYDLPSELEAAYDEYLKKQEAKERYSARVVQQETRPTAAAEDVIYFSTVLTLPVGDRMAEQYRFGAAFDRQTGQKQAVWSLFAVPKEEVLEVFFAKNALTAEEGQALATVLQDEWIYFTDDAMGIAFPRGALAGVDASWSIFLDYEEGLSPLFRPGALPKQEKGE